MILKKQCEIQRKVGLIKYNRHDIKQTEMSNAPLGQKRKSK